MQFAKLKCRAHGSSELNLFYFSLTVCVVGLRERGSGLPLTLWIVIYAFSFDNDYT